MNDLKKFILSATTGIGIVTMTLGLAKMANNKYNKFKHIQQVDSTYNQIMQENCKDLGDSIRFFYNNKEFQKYIKIEEPSFEDKEKIVEKYK